MRHSRILLVCLGLLFVCGNIELAQAEQGWKWASLNPFKQKRRVGWPKLLNREAPPQNAIGQTPRMSEKIKGGTKRFFAKSKELLMPWKGSSAPHRQVRPATGTRRTANLKDPKRKTMFSNWLGSGKKESRQATSVPDWIGQPKPGQ